MQTAPAVAWLRPERSLRPGLPPEAASPSSAPASCSTSRPDGSGQRAVVRGPLPVVAPAWGPAADRPAGTRRPCIVTGTARAETLRGTRADEVVIGGPGADTIFAGGGDDIVLGGSGADFVHGEAGVDRLVGGTGRDRLYGGTGDDVLFALDAQRDLLDGGPGRDRATYDVGLTDGTVDRRRSVEVSGRP